MNRPSPAGQPRSLGSVDLDRLPPAVRSKAEWLLSRWFGRVLIRVAAALTRIEVFDRSVTIAAQFFTSIFPILIAFASLGQSSGELLEALGVPQQTRLLLGEAVSTSSEEVAFGIIGGLLVLGSATSLSRALTRAFAAIWELPRPATKLTAAWRWVAVVLALAMSLVAARALTRFAADLPPATLWQPLAAASCDVAMAVFVPWILMSGRVSPRQLSPGAAFYAIIMMLIRPASQAWLPHALDESAARYGSIGVAFTYLAWLYVVSFCFLASGVLGQVIATDPGSAGRRTNARSALSGGLHRLRGGG